MTIFVMNACILLGNTNWFYLNFTMVLLGWSSLAVLLICPESPEWHLLKEEDTEKHRIEAIKALNTIAWWNGGTKLPEDQ